jgi:hypothetical protein
MPPRLEAEHLPHREKEGGRVNHHSQKGRHGHEKDDQSTALPAARSDGRLLVWIG